jgi:hypothetical protein
MDDLRVYTASDYECATQKLVAAINFTVSLCYIQPHVSYWRQLETYAGDAPKPQRIAAPTNLSPGKLDFKYIVIACLSNTEERFCLLSDYLGWLGREDQYYGAIFCTMSLDSIRGV